MRPENPRFLSVEQIRAKHADIGRATLHGTPPGNWFQRWMDDVGMLLFELDLAQTGLKRAPNFLVQQAAASSGPPPETFEPPAGSVVLDVTADGAAIGVDDDDCHQGRSE